MLKINQVLTKSCPKFWPKLDVEYSKSGFYEQQLCLHNGQKKNSTKENGALGSL